MKSSLIQRVHASVLIFLGIALAVTTTISQRTGTGLYPWLHENPMAHGGLIQAYLLMAVVGTAYWVGISGQGPGWKWDVVGIIAHFPPVIGLLMYWNLFATVGSANIPYISLTLHGFWVALEVFAIVEIVRSRPSQPTRL